MASAVVALEKMNSLPLVITQFSGSDSTLTPMAMPAVHAPAYCGASRSGSVLDSWRLGAEAQRRRVPAWVSSCSGLPAIGLPSVKYATGSYPFTANRAGEGCPDCALAIGLASGRAAGQTARQ